MWLSLRRSSSFSLSVISWAPQLNKAFMKQNVQRLRPRPSAAPALLVDSDIIRDKGQKSNASIFSLGLSWQGDWPRSWQMLLLKTSLLGLIPKQSCNKHRYSFILNIFYWFLLFHDKNKFQLLYYLFKITDQPMKCFKMEINFPGYLICFRNTFSLWF